MQINKNPIVRSLASLDAFKFLAASGPHQRPSFARIVDQSRSVQVIADSANLHTASHNELSDSKMADAFEQFFDRAEIVLPAKNADLTASSEQNSTIDIDALNFSASSKVVATIHTRHQSRESITCSANSSFGVRLDLSQAATLHLQLQLEVATNVEDIDGRPVATARIQTARGDIRWSQLITANGAMQFDGRIPLPSGDYWLLVDAAHNIGDEKIGERTIDTSARFTVHGSLHQQ